jgi:hypothetical protein
MDFKQAVQGTPEIASAYKKGLQALGANSKFIRMMQPGLCNGSVDIDGHLVDIYPQENRWDYVVGYKETAEFIEIHPASTSNIEEMIKKYRWLVKWISGATPLNTIPRQYHWVASGKIAILPGSSQKRRLIQEGIPNPVKLLVLK